MKSSNPYALLGAVALFAAACQSGAAGPDAPAPVTSPAAADAGVELKEPNTLAGIYTPAQARRGRQVYEEICSECHETEEWQDELFLARWNGESVFRFWYYIFEQMPNGAPPYSLPREQVSDVVTYILELNGVPPGPRELGSDDEAVSEHWLYWSVPRG
jgi:mono/diheme cytochrome c family protein